MSGWTELFRGKSSVYALDEVSKEWVDRGISGQLTMFQKNGYTSDIRIKWTKNQTDRWWRLMNGKLKPKGERAWVLKAHDASDNKQEILAIRFSDVQLSQQFAAKFHQIFPPQQAMPSSPMNVNMQMPAQPYPQSPPQPYFNQFPPQQGGMAMNGMMGGGMMNGMMMAGGMMGGGMMMGQGGAMHNPPMMYTGPPAGGGGGGGTWECAVCTYSNEASRASCIMCGLSQDSTHKAQQGQQDARQRSLTGDPSSPQQQQQMGQGRGSAFNFGDHALSQIKGQNSQQRILSQFEMNQLNASAITSPHVKARRNSWICPMCTLHNATSLSRCAACNTNREVNNNNKGQQQQEMRPIHPQMSQPMMPHFSVSVAQPVKYNMNEMHAMMAKMNAAHGSRQASVQEFQQSASDIACYNDAPSQVFSTLRSVAKKLLKDDVRYRTLDTTNPKVMERLIGFEGVLDFLMLLGFESDTLGCKLTCEEKPSPQIVRNAIEVLNTYETRLGFGRRKKKKKNKNGQSEEDDGQSYMTLGGPDDTTGGGPDDGDDDGDSLTLEQIIIWSTHENMRDNDTMETLILTHKQFTTSLNLLKNLRRRFSVPIPQDIRNDDAKIAEFRLNVEKRIQLKVIKSLRDWMKSYWDEDFLNDLEVQQELTQWFAEIEQQQSQECPWIAPLSKMVTKEYDRFKMKSPNQDRKQQREQEMKLDPSTGVPVALQEIQIKKGFKLSSTTADDLADAITLMDYKIFSNIDRRECIGQAWKKKKEQSPNVLMMIQQFNSLTVFVQLQILLEKTLRDRAKSIKRVIKMGERFKELKNYNSLCAILGALNSSPIHRLKAAWQRVPEKQLNQFEHFKQIFINTRNFRNFRQLFRTTSPPAIPYFGLFLQDLVFIDDGNDQFKQIDNFKEHGNMVNFNKCIRTMDRIKNIRLYQTNPYIAGKHLKEQPFLQKMLYQEFYKMKEWTEDKIWNMSTTVKKADEGK
eukprot:41349_1